MANIPTVKDLLQRNAEYQEDHGPLATFKERFGAGLRPPSVAIITCADPRCIPERFFKLNFWDAVVIRNAGSNVRAALPSLCAIDELAGLKEVMVINHTDCGATMYRDADLQNTLRERAPQMSDDIDKMEFGEITTTLEDRVREHVAIVKKYPLLKADLRNCVTGYIYDIKDGSLKQIE